MKNTVTHVQIFFQAETFTLRGVLHGKARATCSGKSRARACSWCEGQPRWRERVDCAAMRTRQRDRKSIAPQSLSYAFKAIVIALQSKSYVDHRVCIGWQSADRYTGRVMDCGAIKEAFSDALADWRLIKNRGHLLQTDCGAIEARCERRLWIAPQSQSAAGSDSCGTVSTPLTSGRPSCSMRSRCCLATCTSTKVIARRSFAWRDETCSLNPCFQRHRHECNDAAGQLRLPAGADAVKAVALALAKAREQHSLT
jgi:hypothetical protein